ncbi:hypothetical protein HDU78_010021 [Chytriomyces hyalinus]|nr:hypothetical protein HDU78_010021 [Chytriomyces hyalinus]
MGVTINMSEALTKEVFKEFDLKYAFDRGRRMAIIHGVKLLVDTLTHRSFHGSDQQTPNDRTSAEEQNEEEGKTPVCLVEVKEEVALASKKRRHPRDSLKSHIFPMRTWRYLKIMHVLPLKLLRRMLGMHLN